MTYPETVSYLMAHGHNLNMMPGDGIVDEMIILRDSVLPYLDQHSHTISDQMTALATIFRSCSKHAAELLLGDFKASTALWADDDVLLDNLFLFVKQVYYSARDCLGYSFEDLNGWVSIDMLGHCDRSDTHS